MRRYIPGVIAVSLFMFQNLLAQDISKLVIPASPAFSILNFEPSAVMRPTNAKSLASDVLNSFDKNGKLLLNLGLEAAPYWIKSHPGLTRETYINPNLKQTFLQSLSFSAATVRDSALGNNKLGAGFRFKLYNGEPVAELKTASAEMKTKTTVVAIINGVKSVIGPGTIDTKQKAMDAIEKALKKKNVDQNIIDGIKKEARTLEKSYDDTLPEITSFLNKLLEDRVEAYGELAAKVSNLLYQRQGFVVEFAGASAYNTSKNNSLDRIGFWANASYYVSPDDLFTLTSRYMFKNTDTALTNFDVGLGFLKKANNYNISIEGMFRWFRAEIPDLNINNQPITRVNKDFTYRLAIQGAFMVSRDVSINLNLGKDFNSPFIAGTGFFSILGFNYSIFNKEIPNLPVTE